jgi:sensor histidine kinase YesM
MRENNWISLMKDSDKKLVFLPPHYPDKWYNTKNDMVFSILKPVYDFNNQKIGFVNADISTNLFQECFHTSSTSSSSLYVMNREDGDILFQPKINPLNTKENAPARSEIIHGITNQSGHFFLTNDNHEKMLVVYHTSSLTNWTTLNVIPEKEIVSAFTNTLHNIILITLLLVALIITCVFIITSLLTKKIRLLANAVRRIDGDCLDLPIEIHSEDEIGALTKQFKAMLHRIRHLLLQVKNEEESKRRAEIAALQFQMNPHFLYNTLNTIKFLSALQGADNIGKVADALSSLMHTNMDGRSFIQIKEDRDFLISYLEIQNYRYTNSYQYRIHVSEEAGHYMIPKLLVQPLVENALKHGLKEKVSDGVLLVDYFIDDHCLKIIVEDNGCGMEEKRIQDILHHNQNVSAGHIGIHNIQERLHMYFSSVSDLEIISQPGIFTRFELSLPLILEHEVTHYV